MDSKEALEKIRRLKCLIVQCRELGLELTESFIIEEVNKIGEKFKDGCGELFEGVKVCGNESWLMKKWGEKLCSNCQLIKEIVEEINGM